MAAARQSWVSGWRGMKIPRGWILSGGKGGCGANPTRWVGDGHKGEDEMVPGDVG